FPSRRALREAQADKGSGALAGVPSLQEESVGAFAEPQLPSRRQLRKLAAEQVNDQVQQNVQSDQTDSAATVNPDLGQGTVEHTIAENTVDEGAPEASATVEAKPQKAQTRAELRRMLRQAAVIPVAEHPVAEHPVAEHPVAETEATPTAPNTPDPV